MSRRRSVEAAGCGHATPIPSACQIGGLLASSVVVPFAVGTREVPSDPAEQVGTVFRRMGRILAEAGAGWDDVARITFDTSGPAVRDAIDRTWVEYFPDPASRPARQTRVAVLPAGMEVQCEFLAVLPDRPRPVPAPTTEET